MLVHDFLNHIEIDDGLIHVHHLILFHFEISIKYENFKWRKFVFFCQSLLFLVKIDIHLQLKYIFVDIHLIYVLKYHVLQVINDDLVQLVYVDNEDYQTEKKKREFIYILSNKYLYLV